MKSIKQDKKKTIGENIGVHCTFIIVYVCGHLTQNRNFTTMKLISDLA